MLLIHQRSFKVKSDIVVHIFLQGNGMLLPVAEVNYIEGLLREIESVVEHVRYIMTVYRNEDIPRSESGRVRPRAGGNSGYTHHGNPPPPIIAAHFPHNQIFCNIIILYPFPAVKKL